MKRRKLHKPRPIWARPCSRLLCADANRLFHGCQWAAWTQPDRFDWDEFAAKYEV